MCEIRKLLCLPWEVRFDNIYREANKYADELDSLGCSQVDPLIFYEQCTPSVGPLMLWGALPLVVFLVNSLFLRL